MKEKGFQVICTQPYVYCKVFEDNSGALELARLPKMRPCTKHINVCYHHFREHVQNGLIKIFPVGTKDQMADILTKALPQNDFQRCHCEGVCDILQCCFNTLGRIIRFFSGLLDHFQHTRKEFMWLNFHILISIY